VHRRIFGPKKDEVTGAPALCISPNTNNVTKSRRMRGAGHVACTGLGNSQKIFVGRLTGRELLEDLGMNGT
jgi:hypothetical protein